MMISISISDYRRYCAMLISEAIKRPDMFYHELWQLEFIFTGHLMAFTQVSGIENSKSFNICFAIWLYETKSVSGSAGWARALMEISTETNRDFKLVFAELVIEFLDEWLEDA